MAGLGKKLGLGAASALLIVVGLELLLQAHQYRLRRAKQAEGVPSHVLTDAPFLYRLNPDYAETGPQGIRDREYAIPKPSRAWRILVLGDSIVYGSGFRREQLFTEILEATPPFPEREVEVVNAGVRGYTTYNEVMYYEAEGHRFGADVVLLCVCLNDIVNPRTHWGYTRTEVEAIPEAAIPNAEVDQRVAQPFLKGRGHWSALARSLAWRRYNSAVARSRYMQVGDRRWPVYLAEETTRIDRWMSDTPEWSWFTNLVVRLRDAAAAKQAQLALVVFPLAYQMEADYPFQPGARIAGFAEAHEIPALDLEPLLRREPDPQSLFLAEKNDIWHLSAEGHQVAAAAIRRFLFARGLVPGGDPGGTP